MAQEVLYKHAATQHHKSAALKPLTDEPSPAALSPSPTAVGYNIVPWPSTMGGRASQAHYYVRVRLSHVVSWSPSSTIKPATFFDDVLPRAPEEQDYARRHVHLRPAVPMIAFHRRHEPGRAGANSNNDGGITIACSSYVLVGLICRCSHVLS